MLHQQYQAWSCCAEGALEKQLSNTHQPSVGCLCGWVQVCCITVFDQEPYLLLGCSSGTVRVAALVNASGDAVSGARQVRSLQLREYTSECL